MANCLSIDMKTLVALPGPSKSSERADAFAAALGAAVDAGKCNGRLFWFAGRSGVHGSDQDAAGGLAWRDEGP